MIICQNLLGLLLDLFILKPGTDIGNGNNYELISPIYTMRKILTKTLTVKVEFALPNHIPVKIRDLETRYSKQQLVNPYLSNYFTENI